MQLLKVLKQIKKELTERELYILLSSNKENLNMKESINCHRKSIKSSSGEKWELINMCEENGDESGALLYSESRKIVIVSEALLNLMKIDKFKFINSKVDGWDIVAEWNVNRFIWKNLIEPFEYEFANKHKEAILKAHNPAATQYNELPEEKQREVKYFLMAMFEQKQEISKPRYLLRQRNEYELQDMKLDTVSKFIEDLSNIENRLIEMEKHELNNLNLNEISLKSCYRDYIHNEAKEIFWPEFNSDFELCCGKKMVELREILPKNISLVLKNGSKVSAINNPKWLWSFDKDEEGTIRYYHFQIEQIISNEEVVFDRKEFRKSFEGLKDDEKVEEFTLPEKNDKTIEIKELPQDEVILKENIKIKEPLQNEVIQKKNIVALNTITKKDKKIVPGQLALNF